MKLYGALFSPFVRKVAAFLNEKGLSFDHDPIVPIGDQPQEFLAASPLKKVPAFRDGDFTLADSTAICTYLDAKYPEVRLIPDEAEARGQTIFWDKFSDTVLTAAAGKVFFNRIIKPRFLRQDPDEAVIAEGLAEIAPRLDFFESAVPDANAFLIGETITLADIAVASPFVNLAHAGAAIGDEHPRTKAWIASIHARASYADMIAAERKMMA
ncbi:glutathione S-transferase family protein [Pacificimonas sp. WHA3]|uniref:Glutathione S-transferase family protein n=1 Tax=Pacificimonas pallii TaxID=2827236 RepID=A0ABS6SAQ8_9SPHN|nr:glutathione S-transferase family protein [Pacificimonas pallii]MBV7255415.1 glutathione S-transferase family protein [Pacificimonas pallii]